MQITNMFNYIKLMRPFQWYKNFMVFLAIVFSLNFLNSDLIIITVWAFIALCCISSANYIINDFIDLKKDKLHPVKKLRPLASGTVSKFGAILLALVLIAVSLVVSSKINFAFLYMVLLLFALNQVYSLFGRNIVFLDIILISTNFVIRAIAGALAIKVVMSPWLLLCPFFLALFLAVGKRKAELKILGSRAKAHKKVLGDYFMENNNILLGVSMTLLVMSYSFYTFFGKFTNLIYSVPIALFLVFRYLYIIHARPAVADEPSKIITDIPMMIGILFFIIITSLILWVSL